MPPAPFTRQQKWALYGTSWTALALTIIYVLRHDWLWILLALAFSVLYMGLHVGFRKPKFFRWGRQFDLHNSQDRGFLIAVAVYVLLTVAGGFVFVWLSRRH